MNKNKVSTCQMTIAKGEKGGWLCPRKLNGGSTSGESWKEVMTNPYLHGIEARVTNTGRVQFEKNGEEVMVYVLVRPELTPKGKTALEKWQKERTEQINRKKEEQENMESALENLIENAGGLEKFLAAQDK